MLKQADQNAQPTLRPEPIAIVGMACRFPGAPNVDAFHRLLRAGESGIREVPTGRWDADAFYAAEPGTPGKMCTKRGGFLDGIEEFAADFFDISPREASKIDPQQRMLLEVTWEALEHAAIDPKSLAKTATGVFVAQTSVDSVALSGQVDAGSDAFSGVGRATAFSAGRLSYVLDLRGPCFVLDTACSGALVAIHQAVASLRSGESNCAIVAGVNALLDPKTGVTLSLAGFLARDGECKTFDSRADGYVRSEGCGVLVVKRLSDALRDGDRIFALVAGSAINHDGRSVALTAPNGLAQEAAIRDAMAVAGVTANDVQYVEAHGTGTAMGDPLEIEALGRAFAGRLSTSPRVLVGSVKTNIGHVEAAAGIASVIKVALGLRHREVFPQRNLRQTNPKIRLDALPFAIPTELRPWRPARAGEPCRAGISGNGFSGTNAHVVLEEAPTMPAANAAERVRPVHLLKLAAKTEVELRAHASRYADHLRGMDDAALSDTCFTANVGRTDFAHRASVVVRSADQAAKDLGELAAGRPPASAAVGRASTAAPRVAFLYTGQGSQYGGMARSLHASEPAFRRAFDHCADALRDRLPVSLATLVFGEDERLHETAFTQPALFAVEWALTELWREWGVVPSAVVGHSIGEYAAACAAGMISVNDALHLVFERGRLMQSVTADGLMITTALDADAAHEAIAPFASTVSVAAYNGPKATVLSGARPDIEAIEARLQSSGVQVRRLRTSHAFHSPQMDAILGDFERAAGQATFAQPSLRFVSNLTGKSIAPTEILGGSYWTRQLREAVRFADCVRSLASDGISLFLEIGPDAVLGGMARAFSDATMLPSLARGRGDLETAFHSLGALYTRGIPVAFAAFEAGRAAKRTTLPSYPFQRKVFPVPKRLPPNAKSSVAETAKSKPMTAPHPLLQRRVETSLPIVRFETDLDPALGGYLADHRVFGRAVFAGAAYLEVVLAGSREAFGWPHARVESVRFERQLVLPEAGTGRRLLLLLSKTGGNGVVFQIHSRPAGDDAAAWELHASGTVARAEAAASRAETIADRRARFTAAVAPDDCYARLRERGLEYGPAFRALTEIWSGPSGSGEAFGRVVLPAALVKDHAAHVAHPILVDAAWHLLSVADRTTGGEESPRLPVAITSMTVNGRLEPELWAHVCVTPSANAEDGSRSADVTLLDEAGAAVVEIRGLRLQAVARTAPETKEASETTEPNVESDLRQRLVASPPDKRLQTMMDFLRREIAIVAGLSPDEAFDLGATLVEVGLTSLMATELQYRIQKGLGVKLESRAPIDLESVETLAESLLKIALEPPRAPAKPRKGGSPATAAATETTSAESEE